MQKMRKRLLLLFIPPQLYHTWLSEAFTPVEKGAKSHFETVQAAQGLMSQTLQNHSLMLKHTCRSSKSPSIDQKLLPVLHGDWWLSGLGGDCIDTVHQLDGVFCSLEMRLVYHRTHKRVTEVGFTLSHKSLRPHLNLPLTCDLDIFNFFMNLKLKTESGFLSLVLTTPTSMLSLVTRGHIYLSPCL